jgi:hypothetical protein
MKTPAGKECSYYYADFHRGRDLQECRLLDENPQSPAWKPRDCSNCPVPEILWANASEHLQLHATVVIGFLGLWRYVQVDALCGKHGREIDDPYIGCAQCAAERPNLSDLLMSGE